MARRTSQSLFSSSLVARAQNVEAAVFAQNAFDQFAHFSRLRSFEPSTATIKIAFASSGINRTRNFASIAPMQLRSTTSIAIGSKPSGVNFVRTSHAASIDLNEARTVAVASGIGRSFKVASVIIPKSPSEPHIKPVRSKPTTFLTVLPPVRIISPVAGDDFQTQNRMFRHAVFRRSHSARVFGDVAADKRIFITRRIRRKQQTVFFDRLLQFKSRQSRLANDIQIIGGNLDNFIHPVSADDNAAVNRNRAARITDAAAARRDGKNFRVGKF